MTIKMENSDIDDLEKIVDLNNRIFSGMSENRPYTLEEYKNRLAGKKLVIFVATDNDKIIGDSIAYQDNEEQLSIYNISCNKKISIKNTPKLIGVFYYYFISLAQSENKIIVFKLRGE